MRAKLKADVHCGTQAYRLEAGTEVEVERFGAYYRIVSPVFLTCWLNFEDLEFASRIVKYALDKTPEFVLTWHHEECAVKPTDEVDYINRKQRLDIIESVLSHMGVKIPTRPEWYRG